MTTPTPAPAGATYTTENGQTLRFLRRSNDGDIYVTWINKNGFCLQRNTFVIDGSPAYAHFAALYPPGTDASYAPEKPAVCLECGNSEFDHCGPKQKCPGRSTRFSTTLNPGQPDNDTSLPALMALKNLLRYAENNVCTHEVTHRGGVFWEICDSCGAMWDDDKGGKPPFEWPAEIVEARQALEATRRLASK